MPADGRCDEEEKDEAGAVAAKENEAAAAAEEDAAASLDMMSRDVRMREVQLTTDEIALLLRVVAVVCCRHESPQCQRQAQHSALRERMLSEWTW